MAMLHLLLECSFDSISKEYRLLHELALLPSKIVWFNPLEPGLYGDTPSNMPYGAI